MKLYTSVIRPIVTYAAETWTLKEKDVKRLQIFERKILRMIYGSVKLPDGNWRIRTNDELDKIIQHRNIVNHVKSLRLSWFGHLHRMSEDRNAKKVYNWIPLSNKIRGRPKIRWRDEVLSDMSLGIRKWTLKVQKRDEWRHVVDQAKTSHKLS